MTSQQVLLWTIKLHCDQNYIYATFLPSKSVRVKVWSTMKSVLLALRVYLGAWTLEGLELLVICTESRDPPCQGTLWHEQLLCLHLHPRLWHAHSLPKPWPLFLKSIVGANLRSLRWTVHV